MAKKAYSDLASDLYDCIMTMATVDKSKWIEIYCEVTGDSIVEDDVEWEA